MKYFEKIATQDEASKTPKLIPLFKEPERRLLSVFMALLEASAHVRSKFFAMAGFKAARTASYRSLMEVEYQKPFAGDARPDGLVYCKRGSQNWAAFIEAKANKNKIGPEQIQKYLELGKSLGVDCVITISNEFARLPEEPPYYVATRHRKGLGLYHFAWADIRTMLTFLAAGPDLDDHEAFLLQSVLDFMWDANSGVMTYDAMPEDWKAFVEASSTKLGFGQNQKGLSEIVHGWQQERRDLGSKISQRIHDFVELRHIAGVRSDEATRLKSDRKMLADEYCLTAVYGLKSARTIIDVIVSLRSCTIETALDVNFPENKGPKAIISWLARQAANLPSENAVVSIDWPGYGPDTTIKLQAFLAQPDAVVVGQKAAPKSIKMIFSKQDPRRFKSRKFFINDLENLVLTSLENCIDAKLL